MVSCSDDAETRTDTDTRSNMERAGPHEPIPETDIFETETRILPDTLTISLSDTHTQTSPAHTDFIIETESQIDSETETETERQPDDCPDTVARILECQGNSARYYEFRDACNSEFLNDESQCIFECMKNTDCNGFLTCMGGC